MLLKYKNVELRHNDLTILDNINLEIESGDFVFITGRVGSGKSTLLSTIYGELVPSKGDATVLDFDLTKVKAKHISALRKQIGIVFQNFELLTDRTVYKNLEFVLKSTGWKNKKEIDARINTVLSKVDLLDKIENFPFELSGGEQQRVVIARALLNTPKIIIADEPTGNLDQDSCMSIMSLLNEIRSEGTAIIMSTHNMALIDVVDERRVYVCENKQFSERKF